MFFNIVHLNHYKLFSHIMCMVKNVQTFWEQVKQLGAWYMM